MPRETPDGPRLWFDWYARTNEAEVVQAPNEASLDGSSALQGSLCWTDRFGNPVEVELVRAVRGDALLIIQCQTEPADGPVLAVGCAAIVERLPRECGQLAEPANRRADEEPAPALCVSYELGDFESRSDP